MATIKEAYVVNVVENGPAFAVLIETNEEVYINKTLVDRHDLQDMDKINVLIVPNPLEPQKTPWLARALTLIETHDAA